jgi:hypothetical protein
MCLNSFYYNTFDLYIMYSIICIYIYRYIIYLYMYSAKSRNHLENKLKYWQTYYLNVKNLFHSLHGHMTIFRCKLKSYT